jgi:hypothetical protein
MEVKQATEAMVMPWVELAKAAVAQEQASVAVVEPEVAIVITETVEMAVQAVQ